MSNEVRLSSMFLSQVERGRPGGLLQSFGRGSNSIRFTSASPSMRAICQNSDRRLLLTMEESGGCSVMQANHRNMKIASFNSDVVFTAFAEFCQSLFDFFHFVDLQVIFTLL